MFRTVSQMARISGTLNCVLSRRSVGLATPPDEQILMCVAPLRISVRAVLVHSSTPSATTVAIGAQHGPRPMSPCPPVCDMIGPPWKRRGPGISHSAVACA